MMDYTSLTLEHIEMLSLINATKLPQFACPGNLYFKLYKLNLITDEYEITRDGQLLLIRLYERMNMAEKVGLEIEVKK